MSFLISRFVGKCVIVTGAASLNGIGFATAARLAGEGASVVLTDIDGDGVALRAAELAASGHAVLGLAHDVTDEAQWDAVVSQAVDRFGRLDGLVNNAGICILRPLAEVARAEWDRQIAINLTGTFLGCARAIDQMRAQGGGGAIVNVSSVAGLVGMRRTAAYAASKGGVRLLTKTLAIEVAAEGIRVNSVHPGVTETDIQIGVRASNPAQSAAIAQSVPMGRTAEPSELAASIAFLLSADASYVTGIELVVDGGLCAQ